jgi:hypothetical protein
MAEKLSFNAPDGATAKAEARALELGIVKKNQQPHLGNYLVSLMAEDAKKLKKKKSAGRK